MQSGFCSQAINLSIFFFFNHSPCLQATKLLGNAHHCPLLMDKKTETQRNCSVFHFFLLSEPSFSLLASSTSFFLTFLWPPSRLQFGPMSLVPCFISVLHSSQPLILLPHLCDVPQFWDGPIDHDFLMLSNF